MRLRGVSKRFGAVAAVRDFDLDIRRGDFLAILGPSGCGKTTLLRIIGGFLAPSSGTVDALIGQAGLDAYTAAKGGVVALTRSLAAGISPEGVRVNAICPGFVETPHQAAFMDVPEERAKIEALHLMPVLQPEDIAEFAAFLASDRARYMTGGIHVVDSGYSAFKGRLDLKDTFGV